jgi:plasmid stability protein
MATTITVRNVPEDVRDELASRAALAGRSLQAFLLAELTELARRPSVEALMRRVRERKAATSSRLPAQRILSHRDRDRK